MNESPSEIYERETGKKHWTNPVCHGETAFASWEYQRWLESNFRRIPWKKYPEEKPEDEGEYYVTLTRKPGIRWRENAMWRGGQWWYLGAPVLVERNYDGSIGPNRVIAFQPLPEPYNEGE